MVERWEGWCRARDLAQARGIEEELSLEIGETPAWSKRWWWLLRVLDRARSRLLKLERDGLVKPDQAG